MNDAGAVQLQGGRTAEIGLGLGVISGQQRQMPLEIYRSPIGRVAPTFAFDPRINRFADGNPAVLTTFGDLTTFTRASSATFVGSNGLVQTAAVDVPRFEHNASGARQGLLVEESRTNGIFPSQELGGTGWNTTRATVSADVATPLAPDGTQTADKLVADASADTSHFVSRVISSVTGAHVYSRFVNAAEISQLSVGLLGGTTPRRAAWDLSTGTVADIDFGGLAQADLGIGIEALPGGWYRVFAAWTADGQTSVREHLAAAGTINIAGTVTGQGLHLWGAQVEPGTRPTSYIKTEAGPVTRARDDCSVTDLSWLAAGQGTMVFRGRVGRPPAFELWRLRDGTGAANFGLNVTGTGVWRISNTADADRFFGAYTPTPVLSVAMRWGGGSFGLSINGAAVETAAYSDLPSVSRLWIGMGNATFGQLNGTVGSLIYYPSALSDTDLQAAATL